MHTINIPVQLLQHVRLAIFLLASTSLYGQQSIKAYVAQHTVPVTSIDPANKDYKDLQAIGNAIGEARIVMLGEQDHGDAPTFLAKTRLVEYLHKEKGFTVLAMESDFFSLTQGWDDLLKNKPSIDSFLQANIFGVWTMCDACQQLFQYIPATFRTNTPLQVTGFDNQLSLSYSYRHLFRKLDSVLRHYQLPITMLKEYDLEILPMLKSFHRLDGKSDTVLVNKRGEYLDIIREQLGGKVGPADFWLLILDNLMQLNEGRRYAGVDHWKSRNARDKQMALNLAWLSDVKYPGQKIIVWAHNTHISKYSGHFPEAFLNPAVRMGHVFTQDTVRNNSTYIIGFTSGEGTAGRLGFNRYKLPKIDKNGFESWVNLSYQHAFTDFKPYRKAWNGETESFSMAGSIKGHNLHTVHTASWTQIFDGVFFIRKMYPCEIVLK